MYKSVQHTDTYLNRGLINKKFTIMKTTFIGRKEVGIWWASAITSGYGRKEITVELCFDGKYKEFRATTNNMSDYDEACDFENVSERYFAFYNLIEDKVIDEVEEWIEDIEGDKQ